MREQFIPFGTWVPCTELIAKRPFFVLSCIAQYGIPVAHKLLWSRKKSSTCPLSKFLFTAFLLLLSNRPFWMICCTEGPLFPLAFWTIVQNYRHKYATLMYLIHMSSVHFEIWNPSSRGDLDCALWMMDGRVMSGALDACTGEKVRGSLFAFQHHAVNNFQCTHGGSHNV